MKSILSIIVALAALGVAVLASDNRAPAQKAVSNGRTINHELNKRFVSKSVSETSRPTARILSASRQALSSVTFTGNASAGWQQQALSRPLSVKANTEVVSAHTGDTYFYSIRNGSSPGAAPARREFMAL